MSNQKLILDEYGDKGDTYTLVIDADADNIKKCSMEMSRTFHIKGQYFYIQIDPNAHQAISVSLNQGCSNQIKLHITVELSMGNVKK